MALFINRIFIRLFHSYNLILNLRSFEGYLGQVKHNVTYCRKKTDPKKYILSHTPQRFGDSSKELDSKKALC